MNQLTVYVAVHSPTWFYNRREKHRIPIAYSNAWIDDDNASPYI